MSGPINFTQPLHAEAIILDGIQLDGAMAYTRQTRGAAVSVLETVNRGSIIQMRYTEAGASLVGGYYNFSWNHRAEDEASWNVIRSVINRGRSVWMVTYDTAFEAFEAAAADTEFTLRRPIADTTKAPPFDPLNFKNEVYLDGVAQTIVTTPPGAGEVTISERTVTTPALSGGEVLEVRYYPAYAVFLPDGNLNFRAFNLTDRQVQAIETPLQTPS